MGEWEIGGVGEWESGKVEEWKSGRVGGQGRSARSSCRVKCDKGCQRGAMPCGSLPSECLSPLLDVACMQAVALSPLAAAMCAPCVLNRRFIRHHAQ